jgi:outer membrane protein with beta-barrel domain
MNARWSWTVVGSLLISGAAWAQTTPPAATAQTTMPPRQMQLAADGALAVPVGNLSNGAGVGIGALLRYEYLLQPQLALTGRAGLIYHIPKTVNGADSTFWTIPILAGAKYALNEQFYVAGELGLFSNHSSATVMTPFGNFSGSASETDFGLTAGAGYRRGDLDIRVALNILNLDHAGDSMTIGANVGYSFWGQ